VILAGVAVSGYDLVYQIQRFVADRFGIEGLYWLMNVHSYYYLSLYWPIFGPLSLLYVLAALHVAPRRRAAWPSLLLTAWAIVRPLAAHWVLGIWKLVFVGGPGTTPGEWLRTHATLDVLTAFFLYVCTRSRGVTGAFVALSVLAWAAQPPSPFGLSVIAVAAGWHVLMAVVLFAWAIQQRQRVFPEGACQSCGYDLCGILTVGGAARCPECGATSRMESSPAV
jgi:hypothetical protein